MSLDFDCNDCERPTCADEEEAAIRKCLVFESVCVGLGSITEDNEQEWMFRSMLLQRVDLSSILYGTDDWDEKAKFLWKALRRWRGMVTNVSPETREEWLKKTVPLMTREIIRQLPSEGEVFGQEEAVSETKAD